MSSSTRIGAEHLLHATRSRVNLRHVPEAERPPQETRDPDDDPTRGWREKMKAAKPRSNKL
jgi:hypothetical protein